jgi:predicted transcriptional regulator
MGAKAMPNLSRRHLVTTAAALPALALPAIADDPNRHNPDADLLRLGVELETIIPEWHAQRALDSRRSEAMQAASDAAGLPDIPYGSLPDEEFRAYQDKRVAAWHTVSGVEDSANDPWDDIHGRMWPLIDAIMDHKPRTLAGLALVARAFTLDHAEQWEADADEGLHHRAFMEAVCAIAGVVPVPTEAVRS